MAINRHLLKRSLASKTKTFIANNVQAIEEFLAPTIRGFAREVTKLEGPRGRVLELSFREARTAWEKFFWASLGYYWIRDDLPLDQAVRRAEDDLLSLSNVLQTVVVSVKEAIDPSITCPISIEVEVEECEIIREEMDEDVITLDPTEEIDLEHPRVLPPPQQGRTTGPEEPTVVEGIRGRPRLSSG